MWLLTPVMRLGMISLIQNWEVTPYHAAAHGWVEQRCQGSHRSGVEHPANWTQTVILHSHIANACNSFFVIIYVLVRMVVWSAV